MIETIDLLVLSLGGMVVGMLFLLYRSDRNTTLFKNMVGRPAIHYHELGQPEVLNQILGWLPTLSIGEKEVILQRLWNRPVKVVKGLGADGSCWFDSCFPFEPNESESNHIANNQILSKKERSPIG